MTFLIVDDHPLFRDALSVALQQSDAQPEILLASNLDDALAVLSQQPLLELVLLDLHLPGNDGFLGLLEMRKRFPAVPVLVVSGNDDADIVARAQSCGSVGFLSKALTTQALLEAIQQVLNGDEVWPDFMADADPEISELAQRIGELTDQQLRVLKHLQAGRLNKQIAFDLAISEATVKAHVTAIFRKLQVLNRTQAVILANRLHVDAPLHA